MVELQGLTDKRVAAMSKLASTLAAQARLDSGDAALRDMTKAAELYRKVIPLAAQIGDSHQSAMARFKLAHLLFDRAGRLSGAA
ncbi:MAG: hypothetical protein KUG70_06530, partial [Rhodobacteraceae bacterium]|nr:hypothetical protein [Paracoccaceae bacterium]